MGELDLLKVGDNVALVQSLGWSRRVRIKVGSVEKVTKTQITAFGRRFMRDSGREVGKSRSSMPPILQSLTKSLLEKSAADNAEESAERVCIALSRLAARLRGPDAVEFVSSLPNHLVEKAGKGFGQ